jgi:hypothetical protein
VGHLIDVFPAIPREWSAGPIKEILHRSSVDEVVYSFDLQIETLSDHVLIHEVVSSLSHYFPHITELVLNVKDPDVERVSTLS